MNKSKHFHAGIMKIHIAFYINNHIPCPRINAADLEDTSRPEQYRLSYKSNRRNSQAGQTLWTSCPKARYCGFTQSVPTPKAVRVCTSDVSSYDAVLFQRATTYGSLMSLITLLLFYSFWVHIFVIISATACWNSMTLAKLYCSLNIT